MSTSVSLYQSIVRDIEDKIARGQMQPGDRALSIGEMCAYYGVSAITAKGALAQLQQRGLLKSVRGKGTYVAGLPEAMPTPCTAPLRRVALLTCNPGLPHLHGFYFQIWQDIEDEVKTRGLELRTHFIPQGGAQFPIDLPFKPASDEGLIFLMPLLSPQVVSLYQNQNIRSVWIDAAYPGAHCVLSDNLDGMSQIVEHLQQLGHKRFLLVHSHSLASNATNENERLAAFEFLMKAHNLHGEIMTYDGESAITRRLKQPAAPTAILFMQDAPAIQFVDEARKKGVHVPRDVSVTGFDDWARAEAGLQELTTLHVDREGLAQRSVELLCDPTYHARLLPLWSRVPGTLVARATTGMAPRTAKTRVAPR